MADQLSGTDDSALEAMLDGAPDAGAEQQGKEPAESKPAQDRQDADDQQQPSDDGDRADGADDGDGRKRTGDPAVALQSARQTAREEREARRRLEAKLEQQQATFQAFMDRMGQQKPQAGDNAADDPFAALEKPIPRWEDDPDGHNAAVEAQRQALRAINAERVKAAQTATQQTEQQRQNQAVMQVAAQHVADFHLEQPDYQAAEQAVIQRKSAEYSAMGLNQAQIEQQLHQDFLRVVLHAHQTNQNAAALIYRMAQAVGYRPGDAPAERPAAQPRDVAADIAQKADNAKKTRSLGSAGGSAPRGKLSADDIGKLTPAEINRMSDDEMADILGLR